MAFVSVVVSFWLLWLSRDAHVDSGYGGFVGTLIIPLIVLALGADAALIGTRRPGNMIAVLFSTSALIGGLGTVGGEYGAYSFALGNGGLPGGLIGDWVGGWSTYLAFVPLLIILPLIFPDGRLLSRRWRLVLGAAAVWLVVSTVYQAVQTTDLHPGVPNPFAIAGPALPALTYAQVLIFVFAPLALLSMALRYRRGSSDVRHQLKWLIFAVAVYFVTNAIALALKSVGVQSVVPEALSIAAILGIPLAALIAVLKYRLYDIDIVISRTLVYGSLAAFITAVYVGIVVGVGTLVGSGGKPNLVLSIVATAIVAVAFQPVRERVQKLANRLVYGKKASPYEVLSQFSERVAESYAADEVLPRMARVLADGTGAIRTGVWLRTGDSVHEAASWPDAPSRIEPLDLVAGGLPEMPGTDGAVPVQHQGELLGALTFTKRPGEPLTPVEEKLLLDLASQAGLVLKNVGLTDELQRRLKDLRASRQRLVAAQDDERRRLERNLHDGAQQNLVALKVKLGLAEMLADKDVRKSRMLLSELQADADAALDTLRSLARGIYPPLLADRGLIAALESHARKATVPTQVEADGIGRYQQDIEAAVYFCCLEALQNVQKYALATRAVLKLADSDGLLNFEISDDGAGFDMASVKPGAGVMNMTDRLDALGGSFEMASSPGHGTSIHGSLPALAVVAAA